MSKQIYYAGIGSRETPAAIQDFFTKLAKRLAQLGFVLRSGGAVGADTSFERGCDEVGGAKEIFLPWERLNGSDSTLIVKDDAFAIAEQFHPRWSSLSPTARKYHARNIHQVLGWDLSTHKGRVHWQGLCSRDTV
jgi:hypothetical protein